LTGCLLSEIFVRLVTAIHKRKLLHRVPFDCDFLQGASRRGRQDRGSDRVGVCIGSAWLIPSS
jgi:hypothetical protein